MYSGVVFFSHCFENAFSIQAFVRALPNSSAPFAEKWRAERSIRQGKRKIGKFLLYCSISQTTVQANKSIVLLEPFYGFRRYSSCSRSIRRQSALEQPHRALFCEERQPAQTPVPFSQDNAEFRSDNNCNGERSERSVGSTKVPCGPSCSINCCTSPDAPSCKGAPRERRELWTSSGPRGEASVSVC